MHMEVQVQNKGDEMKFSIITVSFNSGQGLRATVESCLSQTYGNFELIIKDGLSQDGSTDFVKSLADERVRFIATKDSGIYNAMNQGIPYATGDYVIFMNCGDMFYHANVLEETAQFIEHNAHQGDIYFGDCYVRNRGGIVRLPEQWDAYCCYRYTICHQCMFYKRTVLQEHPFDESCRICACIVHYIELFAREGANLIHMPIVVANYEGGGLSDTPEGRKESLRAQNAALKANFGEDHLRYKLKMLMNGQLIKQMICTVPALHTLYEKLATVVYTRRNR